MEILKQRKNRGNERNRKKTEIWERKEGESICVREREKRGKVCMCVGERGRKRERGGGEVERERQIDRQTDRHTDRQRHREREREVGGEGVGLGRGRPALSRGSNVGHKNHHGDPSMDIDLDLNFTGRHQGERQVRSK